MGRMTGLTGFELPYEPPMTEERARASLSDKQELNLIWDWLERTHPELPGELEAYLVECAKEMFR